MKCYILMIMLVGLCPKAMGTEMSAEERAMQRFIWESERSSQGYPFNFTVIANDTVQLICPHSDNNYQWFKMPNLTITEENYNDMMLSVADAVKDHTNKSYQLTLRNVSKNQEGWYYCTSYLDEYRNRSHSFRTYLTVLENLSLKNNTVLKQYLVNQTYPYLEEEQTVGLTFLWKDVLGHAAAELLRIVLSFSGYNSDFIKVDSYNSKEPITLNTTTFSVEEIDNVYFQAKLSPRAERMSCDLNDLTFYKDFERLQQCDFVFYGSIHIYAEKGIHYFLASKLIRSELFIGNCIIVPIERSALTDMIRNSNESFFFIDAYKQKNMKNIRLVEVPQLLELESNTSRSKIKLVMNANQPITDSYVNFFPYLSDLYGIIDEFKSVNGRNMEEAAIRWLLKFAGYRKRRERFNYFQKEFLLHRRQRQSRVVVIICESDALDFTDYLYMIQLLDQYYPFIKISTITNSYYDFITLFFQLIITDCAKSDSLLLKFNVWNKFNLHQLLGVIVTQNLAVSAASLANLHDVPLYTYDMSSADLKEYPRIYSATGSVEHLALALRRLLADCGWQRLAILSDGTDSAAALLAALQASTMGLTLRNIYITSSTLEIERALQDLLGAGSRVFLVNTKATTAAAVLSAATELNMAHNNAFTWIVREYNAADNATSVTKPISVSYFWRGENVKEADIEEIITNTTAIIENGDYKDKYEKLIRLKLDDKWRNRAWPIYAAPLLDILQNFIRKFTNETLFNKRYLSSWVKPNIMKNDSFQYRDRLMFVQQWGSEPRPRLLATWRVGEQRKPHETCPLITSPPDDGSSTCFLPSGDPFHPICHDTLWFILGIMGIIITIVAIHWSRKGIIRYKVRVKHELTKQILTRRERVFEALSDHIVDRTAVKLLKELGTGRFGRVYDGVLCEMEGRQRNIVVAVKILREEASSAEESEFLREACTLVSLNHKNIIRFVGVCVVGPPLLLMEHAFFGDLSKYLKARRCLFEQPENTATSNCFPDDEKVHVSAKALTALACEAATALAYLAERGIVHRDLRASNCLLDENRSLKVGDFGLARATGTDCDEYQMSRRGMVPVLWMAPESLARGVSSAASDVWSLGVLVSELVTLGRRPYGMQPPAVVLRHVLAGGQPQLPWDASADTRALTRACWRREPEARPPAARLAAWLRAHPAALRPALVEELVYIDKLMDGQDIDDLFSADTIEMKNISL